MTYSRGHWLLEVLWPRIGWASPTAAFGSDTVAQGSKTEVSEKHKYQGGGKPNPPRTVTHTFHWWLCTALGYSWPSLSETGEVPELQKHLQPQHWLHLQPQAPSATCPTWGKPPTWPEKIQEKKHIATVLPSRLETPAAADGGARVTLLGVQPALLWPQAWGGWLPDQRQQPGLPASASHLHSDLVHAISHMAHLLAKKAAFTHVHVYWIPNGPKTWLWLDDMDAHPTPQPS